MQLKLVKIRNSKIRNIAIDGAINATKFVATCREYDTVETFCCTARSAITV